MKKLLFLILVLPMFFATGCGSNESNEPDSNSIIGNSIKIGKLEIAENDFPKKMTWNEAKKACKSLGQGWRLPTIAEFEIMYENKDKIGGFANGRYWSSTEYNVGFAWSFGFTNGRADVNVDYDGKGSTNYVRAVRTF